VAAEVSRKFAISRVAANRHIRKLIDLDLIRAVGNTSARTYELVDHIQHFGSISNSPEIREDKVWREEILPQINREFLLPNVRDICQYGFTEMMNNAVDHSEANKISFGVEVNAKRIRLMIADDGIGIFNKLYRELNLDDERHAAL
jgi:hypothetical protein